jgi:hypothetical protein
MLVWERSHRIVDYCLRCLRLGPIGLEGLVFGVKREVANNICVPSYIICVNRSNSSHVSSDFNSAFQYLHFVAKLDEVLWGSLISLPLRDVR